MRIDQPKRQQNNTLYLLLDYQSLIFKCVGQGEHMASSSRMSATFHSPRSARGLDLRSRNILPVAWSHQICRNTGPPIHSGSLLEDFLPVCKTCCCKTGSSKYFLKVGEVSGMEDVERGHEDMVEWK